MNDPLDARLRQLVHEIADAAPPAPDWDTVASDTASPATVTPAPAAHPSHRRSRLLAAAAVVVLAIGAVVAVFVGGSDQSGITTVDPTTPLPPDTAPVVTPPATIDPAPDPTPSTSSPGAVTPTVPPTAGSTPGPPDQGTPLDAVTDYLDALADGRFDDAARILGEGGLEFERRHDIAALPGPPTDEAELADALREWCGAGALCIPPTSVTAAAEAGTAEAATNDTETADEPSEMIATYDLDGDQVTATYHGSWWEGAPAVTGLPPLVDAAALPTIAVATTASTIAAVLPDGRVATLADGETSVFTPPVEDRSPWSDGSFLFWQEAVDDPDGTVAYRSVVTTFAGDVICETDGQAHRVTVLPDGGYVASTNRMDLAPPADGSEVAVPNEAVDCQTGEATPIDPVSWRGEGSYRIIEEVSDRTFTFLGDAEGNADAVNEDGIVINGDDYAGLHTFSPDASEVVYGVYGDAGPHLSTDIRVRDTTGGELRWSAELDRPFGVLHHVGQRVVADQPPLAQSIEPWMSTEYLVVHDASTGDRIADVPTALRIRHLG